MTGTSRARVPLDEKSHHPDEVDLDLLVKKSQSTLGSINRINRGDP